MAKKEPKIALTIGTSPFEGTNKRTVLVRAIIDDRPKNIRAKRHSHLEYAIPLTAQKIAICDVLATATPPPDDEWHEFTVERAGAALKISGIDIAKGRILDARPLSGRTVQFTLA